MTTTKTSTLESLDSNSEKRTKIPQTPSRRAKKVLCDKNEHARRLNLGLSEDQEITLQELEKWLDSDIYSVVKAALEVCRAEGLDEELIWQWMESDQVSRRRGAVWGCINGHSEEVRIKVLTAAMSDEDILVREDAIEICRQTEIPKDIIEKWIASGDTLLRGSALRAKTLHKDLPFFKISER